MQKQLSRKTNFDKVAGTVDFCYFGDKQRRVRIKMMFGLVLVD